MVDFERIFDAHYSAVDLFTNRIAEHAAFAASVAYQRERIDDGTATLRHPQRRNVMSFYGVGGIGKTELSKRLERWVRGDLPDDDEWGTGPESAKDVRTVRVDFHGSGVVDAVGIVLKLRAAVADAGRCPAFDVGLAAWWAFARPGIALPDLSSPSGFDVRGQITDTLNDIMGEAWARFGVGPLTIRAGVHLFEVVRERRLPAEPCATAHRSPRSLRRCAIPPRRTSPPHSPGFCRGTWRTWHRTSGPWSWRSPTPSSTSTARTVARSGSSTESST